MQHPEELSKVASVQKKVGGRAVVPAVAAAWMLGQRPRARGLPLHSSVHTHHTALTVSVCAFLFRMDLSKSTVISHLIH
jgi:hypothetical protein